MAHIDHPPPTRKEVLERLRPGDVLTHCYRPYPNSLLRADGGVRDEALRARERGVIFDIGHGAGSFGFKACRGLLAAGFRPDVISSDVHVLNLDGPVFDLLTTMSKFLVLGLDLAALVDAVTAAPAAAIRRPSLGTLAPGTEGDATIVDIEDGAFAFRDTQGERIDADRRFRLRGWSSAANGGPSPAPPRGSILRRRYRSGALDDQAVVLDPAVGGKSKSVFLYDSVGRDRSARWRARRPRACRRRRSPPTGR